MSLPFIFLFFSFFFYVRLSGPFTNTLCRNNPVFDVSESVCKDIESRKSTMLKELSRSGDDLKPKGQPCLSDFSQLLFFFFLSFCVARIVWLRWKIITVGLFFVWCADNSSRLSCTSSIFSKF